MLVIIASAVASIVAVTAVVAVTIAIEVRPLGIIALTSLRISLARVNAVPVTVIDRNLIYGVVPIIPTIPIVAPIIPIAAIIPIVAPIVSITSIVSISPVVSITVIAVLRPPLRLNRRARHDPDGYQKGRCQQDSPEFFPEKV